MLARLVPHLVAVLGLGYFVFDLQRTIRQLGTRRRGLAGAAVSSPYAHLFMAGVLAAGFLWLSRRSVVPVYVAPIGWAACVVYAGAALRAKVLAGRAASTKA